MNRDQLEARAWTIAQRLVSVIPQERCDAMDDLLNAVDEYAANAPTPIKPDRRSHPVAVHWRPRGIRSTACGQPVGCAATHHAADVTCPECKGAPSWTDALAWQVTA